MLFRALLAAVIVAPFSAVAQNQTEPLKSFEPKILDTDRWIRGELGPKKLMPKLAITPPRSEGRDGKCSILLKEFRPESTPRMKTFPPKTEGFIRFVKPPAPPCEPEREGTKN